MRNEVEVRVKKLKNVKVTSKNEPTGEMIKGGVDMMVELIWRLCIIVPLYKGKEERTECSNYIDISLLSVFGKIYAGILLHRVRRVTESLMDDEQGGFRSGSGYVDKIYTLIGGIGERVREKNAKCIWLLLL